jgi:hypothetical protein
MIDSLAELTLEARDPQRPDRDEGGRHVHFGFSAAQAGVQGEDPEGNSVEIWDFFRRGSAARDRLGPLR